MQLGDFELVNDEKVNRAIHGSMGRNGALTGGVGEDAEHAAILAEYDRLGGLIRKEGAKVKTGAFYDFEKKTAHKKPQVKLLYRVNDKDIEVPDGEELPLAVKAQQIADAGAKEAKAPKGKAKGKKKAEVGDEEEKDEEETDA